MNCKEILIFSFCYFLKQIVTDGADLSAKARKGKINGTEVAPFREFSMVMVVSMMMMMMTMVTMVIVMITGPKVDRVCVVQSNSVCAQWTPIIASLHHHHCFIPIITIVSHHHRYHDHCFTSSSPFHS